MTQQQIINRARERLDEDLGSASQRYPSDTLAEYVVDGVRWFVARTGNQNETTTITQTANTLLYDLPCDCIQVERVLWDSAGTNYPLEAVTPRILDAQEDRFWQRRTDTRARAYFIFGVSQIALWPISEDGGEEYTVHYQQDVFDAVTRVPVEDHESLVSYVIARCLLSEGKAQDGAKEYAAYAAVVAAAQRRMASVDRMWSMSSRSLS